MAIRLHALLMCVTVVLVGNTASTAFAQVTPPIAGVKIDGRYAGGDKVKLMVDFVKGPAGDSITEIISRDLRYSDRYEMLAPGSAPGLTGPINYALFAQLGAHGVVEANVLPSGWLHVEVHDIPTKSVLQKNDFQLASTPGSREWRMSVHGVSDAIEEWITGQRGIAQSQIAFNREGRIWIVDSDGANARAVTPAGLTPKWTPNGRALVYNINNGDVSPIMLTDIATGAQKTLTNPRSTQGIDYAPAVTPDGRDVLFARNAPSGTNIYKVSISGGTPEPLTTSRGRSNNGSPTPSPDGQHIAFASDRGGFQDVYMADIDGTNVTLLTPGGTGEKNHDTPDWSPDGKFVAYQTGRGGSQQIYVVDVRNQSTKQVTESSRNDDPSWAPDSRHVVVTTTRYGLPQLMVVDTQTGVSRQLTRGSSSKTAAWSPRLTGTP